MNNKLFASLLCITVLASAPACSKRKEKTTKEEPKDINTLIELDNSVFEIEEDNDTNVVKF